MKNNSQQWIKRFNRMTCLLVLFYSICSVSYAENAQTTQTPTNQTTTATPAPTDAQFSTQDASTENQLDKDPYGKFNRGVFAFNDKLDTYLLKPIARFYNAIMPRPLNQGIHNFFLNIGNLPTIANDILQFNFYQMANDMWRLGINTTVGIGGLFDIAGRMDLAPYKNDFGLTLATWGYKNSNYLVLPFFGPSTPRDGIGIPVDYYIFSIYPHIHPNRTRYVIYGLGVIDRRAQLLQFQNVMEEVTLDKYVFMRNAYMQRRAYEIDQNQHLSFKDKGWPGANQYVASTQSTPAAPATTSEPVKTDVENQPSGNGHE